MKFFLIIVFCMISSIFASFKSRPSHTLLTCFTCSGASCSQPFNLSESGIYSSLCADGCVMQQIKLNKNIITTIRGCITMEGCRTYTHNAILYENSCCFSNLCNSFFQHPSTTTTSTTTTTTTSTSTTTTLTNTTSSIEHKKNKLFDEIIGRMSNNSFLFKFNIFLSVFQILFLLIIF